jgi:hypothetical protein
MAMRTIPGFTATIAATLLLASCGGGGTDSSGLSMPSPQAARAALSACDTAGLQSGEYQLVGAECVRSTPLIQPTAQSQQAQTTTTATITATQLMDWAESQFAAFFPVAGKISATVGIYAVRYYPNSGNYIGVTSEATPAVYVLGPITGNNLVRLGALSAFTCSVTPSACTTSTSTGGTTTTGTGSTTTTSSSTTSTSTTTTTTSSSSTAGVQCSYSYNALNSSASVNKTSTVAWACSSSQRSVTGNGIPDHSTGTFPNSSNPSAIAAVTVNASMPLIPAIAASVTNDVRVVGYVLNGIKMDPATAATCSGSGTSVTCTADGNTGTWKIEALGQSVMNLGLDSNNAHVQPDGSYHYHGMPEGFLTRLGGGTAMRLVGFALDGFPIYARYGYSTATSASSSLKVITSSWQLKTTADSGRPSTTSYPMGTFTQDYQYVAGSGDLDECNGRTGVTPEFPSGIYHYFVTDTWPYIGRCFKGTSTTATR